MPEIPLPVHSYELRSKAASPARLVNVRPELLPGAARSPVIVTHTEGIRDWIRVGSGPIRGLYSAYVDFSTGGQTYLYVVSGTELYYVTSAGVPTLIGDIGPASRIDIDSNVGNVVVVNQPDAYYWDGTTFAQITDADFVDRGAGDVEFLDNFLLFREPDSGRFFGADLGSVTDFNALRFATAETSPDNMEGMKALHRILYAFGTRTLEMWENTGASGFPFERIVNATIEMGCENAKTVAEIDNTLYWLADDLTVRRLEGVTPSRISTHAVEQFIAKATRSSAEAFTFELEGHFYYVLSFDEGTFAFDVVSGEWAERSSYDRPRWQVSSHAQFAGLELVGNRDTNEIGILDPEFYWEWGASAKNLVLQSDSLTVSPWSNNGYAATANYAKAVTGLTTATRVIDDASSDPDDQVRIVQDDIALEAASTYVVSVWAKPDQLNWTFIRMAVTGGFSTGIDAYFDLLNGVEGTIGQYVKDYGMIDRGNGYYQCWLSFTTTIADSSAELRIGVADADGDAVVNLDGTSSIIVDRAQVEKNTSPSGYVDSAATVGERVGVLRKEWTYQTIYAEGQRAFHDRLEIVLETGVGATTGQGSAPQIVAQYSDDGETWKTLPARSLGALGKREARAVWHNLGSARQRVYRAYVSDPVSVTMMHTLLNVRGGRL